MNSDDEKLRVLLIGRHELARCILEVLLGNTAIRLACVPARREDSDRRPTLAQMPAAKSVAILGGDKKTGLRDAIEQFLPHIMVSAGFDSILTAETLACVPRSVNVHFGMLPKYRGNYSIPWAILNNELQIGVTLHDMAPSIDDGPITRQDRLPNEPSLSCRDIYDRAVRVGTEQIVWLIDQTLRGAPPAAIPQDEREATYYPPEYPGGYRIPWRQTATYVANYIRAAHFPPYEGAFGEIAGFRVVFDWPVEYRFDAPAAAPGTVIKSGEKFGVAVVNGTILPKVVTVDGRAGAFTDFVAEHSLIQLSFARKNAHAA